MESIIYCKAVSRVLGQADAKAKIYGRRVPLARGIPHEFAGQPIIGPQCVTVTLKTRPEDLSKILALDEQFAQQAGSQYARVYRDGVFVRVEFTLPLSQWRDVFLGKLPHMPNGATIGRKALGPPARIGWDWPHKAVFGSTQAGKTTCMADFIISLAQHEPVDYRFVILNPKNDPALNPFARLPHLVAPVAVSYEDCYMLLRYVQAEMEKRRADYQRRETRWVIFVDEVAELVQVQPGTGEAICRLSQMAGGLNINLVVASQAANPKVFGERGSLAQANFGSRLVFQLPNDQAWLATKLKGQRTAGLAGKGDGLAVLGDRVTRFRAALPLAVDYEELPRTERPPAWPSDDDMAGERVSEGGWQVPPDMLAYSLVKLKPQGLLSATQIQRHYGGAMDKARLVRDYAAALLAAVKEVQSHG